MLAQRTLFPLLLLLMFASCGSVRSQSATTDMRKSDQKELAETQSLFTLGELERAGEKLAKLLDRNAGVADLHYLDSEIKRGAEDYSAALDALERGLKVDGDPPSIVYRKRAELYTLLNRYGDALTDYEQYEAELSRSGRGEESIARARELVEQAGIAARLSASPRQFSPEPVRGGINTAQHLEYFPSLSVDGKTMIFTRRVDKRQEDFYQSSLEEDGSWGPAVPLPGINTPMNEGAQSITADGNLLVFTGCGRQGGLGSCDLYYSERLGDRWSEAKNLGPSINSRSSESQPSLSRDGRLLFFTSNRPGGLGNDDLYVSARDAAGNWSQPVNLGPKVNTAGQDRYPFWSSDNRTLYFTSDGWPGMGGADLFVTRLDEDNQWEAPENLGYPINTPGQETNLFIALDGKTAYFSKGIGDNIDIYTFQMPGEIRPAPATYVEITVVDEADNRPLTAAVRLQTQAERTVVSASTTDRFGRYLTVLPTGENYGLTVEKEGYVFHSERFELTGDYSIEQPFELRIALQLIDAVANAPQGGADGAITLKNVFFETGSAELKDLSTEELDRLVALLEERAEVSVEIAGHTDDVGAEEDNQRLSELRAESVKSYLVTQGIEAGRVRAIGYGESQPVADNDTEEGRARNRRTTFRLLF